MCEGRCQEKLEAQLAQVSKKLKQINWCAGQLPGLTHRLSSNLEHHENAKADAEAAINAKQASLDQYFDAKCSEYRRNIAQHEVASLLLGAPTNSADRQRCGNVIGPLSWSIMHLLR